MQGLMVVGFIVDEILRVGLNKNSAEVDIAPASGKVNGT